MAPGPHVLRLLRDQKMLIRGPVQARIPPATRVQPKPDSPFYREFTAATTTTAAMMTPLTEVIFSANENGLFPRYSSRGCRSFSPSVMVAPAWCLGLVRHGFTGLAGGSTLHHPAKCPSKAPVDPFRSQSAALECSRPGWRDYSGVRFPAIGVAGQRCGFAAVRCVDRAVRSGAAVQAELSIVDTRVTPLALSRSRQRTVSSRDQEKLRSL